jgi:hypothetical protein
MPLHLANAFIRRAGAGSLAQNAGGIRVRCGRERFVVSAAQRAH